MPVQKICQEDPFSPSDFTRRRYQLMALRAIGAVPELRERLVLRGSGAMWAKYLPARSAADLDFVDLARPLSDAARGIEAAEARVRQALSSHFLQALAGDAVALREAQQVVSFDICPLYMPLSPVDHTFPGGGSSIRVCDLEYLIAEKTTAIAEQMQRDRFRPNDPFDVIDLLAAHGSTIDLHLLRSYLDRTFAVLGGTPVTLDLFCGPLRQWVSWHYEKDGISQDWLAVWAEIEKLVARLQVADHRE